MSIQDAFDKVEAERIAKQVDLIAWVSALITLGFVVGALLGYTR